MCDILTSLFDPIGRDLAVAGIARPVDEFCWVFAALPL
jgi:hypothetical protein